MKRPAAAPERPTIKRGRLSLSLMKRGRESLLNARRPPVDTDVDEKCEAVIEVLKSHKEIPAEVISVLCFAVQHSLRACADDRHAFENVHVEQIGKVLEITKLSLEEEVAKYQKVVDNADSSKADLESAEKETKNALEKLRSDAAESDWPEQALSDAQKVNELKDAVDAAKRAKEPVDNQCKRLESKKESLEGSFVKLFYPMRVISVDRQTREELLKLGSTHGFDARMLDKARVVLRKKPERRGNFDEMVLSSLEAAFQRKIADMASELVVLEHARNKSMAMVEAAQKEHDDAQAKAIASSEVLDKAFFAQVECEKDLTDKKKAVSRFFPELKKAAKSLDIAKAAHSKFMSGPMQAYYELKELGRLPPEEPELELTLATACAAEEAEMST
mmetsp:Transcript_30681/g.56596  ORF Transcript_30681/g.56596 Transcript_30681/m.56596 type:complete len:390 (+) Transcript_30681:121-1290(+)